MAAMDVIHRFCAGLDVHKKSVMVCVLKADQSNKPWKEVREFGTTTRDLLVLGDWLAELGVTHVAMESTGVFWKPIYNILEGRFEILLVNAHHIKQVPGRKTDVKDCEWIAQLLQHGLLRASFVPPKPVRELRDLARHRVQVTNDRTQVANRIQKVLEDANIKLGSVASDVLGASGRDMIQSLIGGEEDPEKLADLARRKLRGKIPELRLALEGKVTDHHRFMLEVLFEQLQSLESLIERLTARIVDLMASEDAKRVSNASEDVLPFQEAVSLLVTIPGIRRLAAQSILPEIGTNMSQFPSADHLSSWAGISSGNNESAGKRRSGKTPKGNRWIRRILVQVALAAGRSKDTYLSAQYRRIAARRGKKRAAVAVAHTVLVIIYHVLKRRKPYQELGANYFDRLNPERLTRQLVKRLESLGHKVILAPMDVTGDAA
jgi:transposase